MAEPYFLPPDTTGFATPGTGNNSAGGVSRGPQCAPGYSPGPGGQGCVRTTEGQVQDIALQNLRKTANAPAAAAPAPAPPVSPASAYQNSSTSTTTTTTAPAGGGSGGGGSVAREAGPNSQAGTDANLLRAKDRQGQLARSAVTGLRSALGERGMLGSGLEEAGTTGIAGQALQNLSDVNREDLIQRDQNSHQEALADYQGRVGQRGQDIGSNNAMAALAMQGRGQDIGANVAFRGQDVTARGQDIAGQSAAGQLGLQQQNAILAALKAAALY